MAYYDMTVDEIYRGSQTFEDEQKLADAADYVRRYNRRFPWIEPEHAGAETRAYAIQAVRAARRLAHAREVGDHVYFGRDYGRVAA